MFWEILDDLDEFNEAVTVVVGTVLISSLISYNFIVIAHQFFSLFQ